MTEALTLLERCLANQEPVLNLGNCGLCDHDFSYNGMLWSLLAKCTHVKTLILSNYQYGWMLHEAPALAFNARYNYQQKNTSWERGFTIPKSKQPIHYFNIPTFRPLVNIGAGKKADNQLRAIPAVVGCLQSLEVLVCGGNKYCQWEIDCLEPIRGLDKLKTLILSNNRLTTVNCLHWFPQLERLDISNNCIDSLHKVTEHARLEYLDLSHNQLAHSYEICKFPNLRWLSLASNQLDAMHGVNRLPLLQVLDISGNVISDFRPFERNVLLEKLNLSNNLIPHLDYLGEVPKLQYLFARCNRIKQVRGIKNLEQLKVLDLSHNMIGQLPVSIGELKALETLEVSNNHLQSLANVFQLPKLRLINASTNYINHINCDAECRSLEELNLSNNRLSELNVIPFSKLKKLYARENDIEDIMCFGNMCLSEVVLSNNKLKSIQFAEECIHLQYLEVNQNKISTLDNLGCHPKLSVLYAADNSISGTFSLQHLPDIALVDCSSNNIKMLAGIEGLPKLTTINLENNIIEELGQWRTLPSLQSINIQGNRIRDLADRLCFLPALKTLFASRNRIVAIPDLQLYPKLERLILTSNRIDKFDKQAPHPTLKEFRLEQNMITVIEEVDALFNYHQLHLSDNPISRIIGLSNHLKENKDIYILQSERKGLEVKYQGKNVFLLSPSFQLPEEVIAGGSNSIKDWIIAMDEGGVINTEIRIILMGNGETGKTALAYYYTNGRFYRVNNRTHGICINKWEIKLDELSKELQEQLATILKQHVKGDGQPGIKSITINIWDFGGQEFYHATHRLFMSKDILYLVLWNKDRVSAKEKGRKKKEATLPIDFWIKNIAHFAPGSQVLLVQNKADNEYAVDNVSSFKICRREERSPDSILQYNLDMKILKEGILKQVAALPNFARYIPKVYDDIKAVIKNLKKPFITFAEYEAICRKTDFSVAQIMSDRSQRETLLKYLDNIGAVVCFRYHDPVQDEYLKNYIFTDPTWLVNIIYEILGDDEEQFEFDREHVEKVVAKYGVAANVWIKIMKNAGLIFELVSEESPRYVIPQYLPEVCKDQTAYIYSLFSKHMPHSFTLHYPGFMPVSNFLRLISHYGREHVNNLYWKNGLVFFRNTKTVSVACDIDKRTIRVSVQDNDSKIVNEVLERIYEIDPVDDLEISIDEESFVPLAVLRKKMTSGKLEIDATNGETFAIQSFTYLFKNHSMNTMKILQPKKKIRIFISYSSKDRALMELLLQGLKDHLSTKLGYEIEFWVDKAIDMGADWDKTIHENISKADAAIILVSAGFVASPYIRNEELSEFLKRMTREGFLILPVLIRNYDFVSFEDLSGLQFFKAYYDDYGYNKPIHRKKLMPFDVLGEDENATDSVLNDYYRNLADMIFRAVSNKFSAN